MAREMPIPTTDISWKYPSTERRPHLRHHELPHPDAVPGRDQVSPAHEHDDLSCGDWGRDGADRQGRRGGVCLGSERYVHCAAVALASALQHVKNRTSDLSRSRTCQCSKRSTCIAKWKLKGRYMKRFTRYFSVGAVAFTLVVVLTALIAAVVQAQTLADLKTGAQAEGLVVFRTGAD